MGMSLSVGAAQLMEGGDQTSSLLSIDRVRDTIRVFAYKDLPSLLSDPVLARFDGNMRNLMTA